MASRFVMTIGDDDPVPSSASEDEAGEERSAREEPAKAKVKGKKAAAAAAAPAEASAPASARKGFSLNETSDLAGDFDFEMELPGEMKWDPSYQFVKSKVPTVSTDELVARVIQKQARDEKRKRDVEDNGESEEEGEGEDESEGEGSGESEGEEKGKKKSKDKGKDKSSAAAKKNKPKKMTLADLDKDLGGDLDDVRTEAQGESSSSKGKSSADSFFSEAPAATKAVSSFSALGLSRAVLKGVSSAGYSSPSSIQGACIPLALCGRDVCACAATGSGKTAGYLLPCVERLMYRNRAARQPRVCVLSPTRELAIQVWENAKTLAQYTDITFALAVGGLSVKVQEAELRNRPDVIIATPGRLVDHLHNTPGFDLATIEVLVLDEADRLLEVGFADEVDVIVRHCPSGRQTMLFSATMTDAVEDLIKLSLRDPVRLFIDRNKQVTDNLVQEFVRIRPQHEGDRDAITLALCRRVCTSRTVVFVRSRAHAHRLCVVFSLAGLRVCELHGGLTQAQRTEALERFRNAGADFIICTDLAGRGIDIQGVEAVVNWSMPNSIKQYIHRVGRTARAGRSGRAITLVGDGERRLLRELHRSAEDTFRTRAVSAGVIERYRAYVSGIQGAVADVLRAERDEAALGLAEAEAARAQNVLLHREEILARPPRTWHLSTRDKRTQKELSKAAHEGQAAPLPSSKALFTSRESTKGNNVLRNWGDGSNGLRKMSEEERASVMMQQAMARKIKCDRKPKRMHVFADDEGKGKGKGARRPAQGAFTTDLTDTSRKAVKQLRAGGESSPSVKPRPSKSDKNKLKVPKQKSRFATKGKSFKSKTRFKRR